ncbi:MAG: hypothetical protein V7L05_29780 [Nostoc sp.]|uniref:hypothetical protein n=1 Tax=Nostoc sp. TaxID=1180 RepID=UPI002FF68995
MGSGEWGDEGDGGELLNKFLPYSQCPMPNAQCPMPHAPCPMPYSPFPLIACFISRTALSIPTNAARLMMV